jgi:2-methylisocitrate lyase-like PEP mutase family enzyme
MKRALREIEAPLMFNYVEGRVPPLAAADFERLGFKVLSYPVASTLAYAHMMTAFARELKRSGTTRALEPAMLDLPTYEAFLGREHYA